MTLWECTKCQAKSSERRPIGWASVLHDESGSIPLVLCPKCADRYESGLVAETDPDTGERRTVRKQHRSTVWRL